MVVNLHTSLYPSQVCILCCFLLILISNFLTLTKPKVSTGIVYFWKKVSFERHRSDKFKSKLTRRVLWYIRIQALEFESVLFKSRNFVVGYFSKSNGIFKIIFFCTAISDLYSEILLFLQFYVSSFANNLHIKIKEKRQNIWNLAESIMLSLEPTLQPWLGPSFNYKFSSSSTMKFII